MTEPDVVLTDYALAVECAILAWMLWRRRAGSGLSPLSVWFATGFAATGLAALVGGTVHGFFGGEKSLWRVVLWPVTLLMVGLAALAFIRIAALLRFAPKTELAVSRAATALFLVYGAVVLFFDSRFVVAIIAYLPAVLFLGWVFLERYLRVRRRTFAWGLAGIAITLGAAVLQQAGIGLHPRYFNHNALYHTLQGAGLFLIFLTARELS